MMFLLNFRDFILKIIIQTLTSPERLSFYEWHGDMSPSPTTLSERRFQLFVRFEVLLVMAISLCAAFMFFASLYECGEYRQRLPLSQGTGSANFPQLSKGGLRFASYYGDHMVLQRAPESAVLWGYGPEGANVTLTLAGPTQQKHALAVVTNGIWRVTLDPVEAGGPYEVTAAVEDAAAVLTDVLFGDVWLCGGQSNMWLQTSKIFNASDELRQAEKFPHVRIFMAALRQSETEETDLIQVEHPWSVPPENVADFSAVCWLFGRYLHETLRYPIGLVESCWGGTPVEVWSSPRALQQCGLQQTASGPNENSVLWNAMIHPLLNMTVKGAIWYQGEANAEYNQEKYNCSFPAMIDDWRLAFHRGSGGQTSPNFPFGFVQLSTYRKGSKSDGFPNIRWHQTADHGFAPNPRMQNTFMAVALDLPDKKSPYDPIHPRDKQDVAHRLSLGARAVAYDEKGLAFQGPFPKLIASTSKTINVTYDQKVRVTSSGDVFEVCCTKGQARCGPGFAWVPAPIMQWGPTTVQLSSDVCPPAEEASALRYAWKDWPCDFKACPVYSASGDLPAPPFITERSPTVGRQEV
ncbi:sialate O-acetylesterase isoform X2 [Pungitius pungitius]|uniref:sialate O-acetylesterase isoform X2 n=1 Tax=Pungitius pungitius TaxID=134920 RepID=UPI002E135C94